MPDKAILFDATRCTACRGCQTACKQWNENDEGSGERTVNQGTYENPADLSPNTWLKITLSEVVRDGKVRWLFNRLSCHHCTDAGCVTVCPTRALHLNEFGTVSYHRAMCCGCGYCTDACPFKVPRMTRDPVTSRAVMDKCTFCTTPGLDRIAQGWEPACVKTCPTKALVYGDRDYLVANGKKRVQALVTRGLSDANLYGDKELGGLHVLYVLDESPTTYGLPGNPTVPVATIARKGILQPAGWGLGVAAILGIGVSYIVARANRKQED